MTTIEIHWEVLNENAVTIVSINADIHDENWFKITKTEIEQACQEHINFTEEIQSGGWGWDWGEIENYIDNNEYNYYKIDDTIYFRRGILEAKNDGPDEEDPDLFNGAVLIWMTYQNQSSSSESDIDMEGGRKRKKKRRRKTKKKRKKKKRKKSRRKGRCGLSRCFRRRPIYRDVPIDDDIIDDNTPSPREFDLDDAAGPRGVRVIRRWNTARIRRRRMPATSSTKSKRTARKSRVKKRKTRKRKR